MGDTADVAAGTWMYVAPLLVVLATFAVLLGEHLMLVKHVRFQGVFLRSVLIFPIVALLAFWGGYAYHLFEWIHVVIALVEGYVFLLFYGLFVGWAWCNGDVHANIMGNGHSQVPIYLLPRSWFFNRPFANGAAALWSLKWRMYQYAVVKPLADLISAVVKASAGADSQAAEAVALVSKVAQVISTVLTLQATFILYSALRKGDGKPDSKAGQNLLRGLQGVRKFLVIKLFLWAVIANAILINPLVDSGVITAPSQLCVPLDPALPEEACHARLEAWIIMIEAAIVACIGALSFRHSAIDALDNCHKNKGNNTACSLFASIFKVWDVVTSLPTPPTLVCCVELEEGNARVVSIEKVYGQTPEKADVSPCDN
jgi:hypothetical protein